jgi:hypothetical protein
MSFNKSKYWTAASAFGVLVLLLAACQGIVPIESSQSSQTPSTQAVLNQVSLARPQWEYLTLSAADLNFGPFGVNFCSEGTCFEMNNSRETSTQLNELGEQGWELVSVIYNSGEYEALLIFKRQVMP